MIIILYTYLHIQFSPYNPSPLQSGGSTTSPLLGKPPGDLDDRLLLLFPALVIHKHQVQEQ